MVPPARFELAAPSLPMTCSTPELRRLISSEYHIIFKLGKYFLIKKAP